MISNLHLFKLFLAKASLSGENELLQQLLDAAEAAAQRWCDRAFAQATLTEYYSGTGEQALPLRQFPVTTVFTVHLDAGGYFGKAAGAFPASSLLTEASDYVLNYDSATANESRSGLLFRLGGSTHLGTGSGEPWYPYSSGYAGSLAGRRGAVWPRGIGNIRVQYTHGYTAETMPADLQEAVHQLAAWMKRSGKYGSMPVQSESLGSYSYSLAQQALQGFPELGTTRQLLSRFRRQTMVWVETTSPLCPRSLRARTVRTGTKEVRS